MTDTTLSPTAVVNLQTVTQKLVTSINAFDELRNIDVNDFWNLARDLKRASTAYAMQVANDRAYEAAYAAAEQVNKLSGMLLKLNLDEYLAIFAKPYQPMAHEFQDTVRSVAVEWRLSHNDGFGSHPVICERAAELLPQAFMVLAVYTRYDAFVGLFGEDDGPECASWLDDSAMALHVWTDARDYRNQLKTALGIK